MAQAVYISRIFSGLLFVLVILWLNIKVTRVDGLLLPSRETTCMNGIDHDGFLL